LKANALIDRLCTMPTLVADLATENGIRSLAIAIACQTRNLPLLKECLRDMGLHCSEKEAKWAINNAKLDLNERDRSWLESSLLALYKNSANAPAYWLTRFHFSSKESKRLSKLVATKINSEEMQQLERRAASESLTVSEITRKALRLYLQQTG
jgi:hypothetical protein